MTTDNPRKTPRRVLIASSHPLFGKGLARLLTAKYGEEVEIVGIVENIQDALREIEAHEVNLIFVDYDDEVINRDEFMAYLGEGETHLRIILSSLKDGGQNAVVYDRRSAQASQIENWFYPGIGEIPDEAES